MQFKILAIDIGAGTQDILLYNENYESSYKLILPSPTRIFAEKVRYATKKKKNLVINGETMGGGPFNYALFNHLEKGFKVFMTEISAFTVRDDLNFVKRQGIKIIDNGEVEKLKEKENFLHLELKDVDKNAIENSLKNFNIELNPKVVAIAVEDHGVAEGGEKDRNCRFRHFKEFLPCKFNKFGFVFPPKFYSRMLAVKRTLKKEFKNAKHLIMDSKISALIGASKFFGKDAICIDAGNGHTTVGAIENERLIGIFEHHTYLLNAKKMDKFLGKFIRGELTHEEIFNDDGHGCYMPKEINAEMIATGPRRNFLKKSSLEIKFVNPYGDVMLTGNVGLTEIAKERYNL